MSSFAGKVVLITGASSGIGASTALEFSKAGASVVIVGRNEEKLQAVFEDLQKVGKAEHLQIIAELREESQVVSIVEQTLAKYRRLDVLVNNAGAARFGSVEQFTMEDFDWVLSVNLRSVVHLTKLCIPHLIATKGNIVNVSSVAGINPIPDATNYCLSKAALDQFTKTTAVELGPKGVRSNSVNPAVIVTNFHTSTGMTDETYKAYLDNCAKMYPLGRVGQPKEVADAILYLASESAAFVTGILLPLSGGKHLALK